MILIESIWNVLLSLDEFNNNLLILTSTATNIKNLTKTKIDEFITVSQKKLKENNSSDKEKYILSYKINTLKEINQ